MKRSVLSFILILAIQPLFAETCFRSNAMGQPLGIIDRVRVDEFPYVLMETDIPGGKRSILLNDGVEVKRWEIFRGEAGAREERYYEHEILVRITVFSGLTPVSEEEYQEGALSMKVEYRYLNGLIYEIVYRDAEGSLLYTDSFDRDQNGRLRRVVRGFDDGRNYSSLFRYSGSTLFEEWCDYGPEGILYRFVDSLLVSEERWRGDLLVERTEYRYQDGIRVSSSFRDYETGAETETEYDADSLPVHAVSVDGKGNRQEIFFRNREGFCVEKTVKGGGSSERWLYTRSGDGKLISEDYWKNGVLIRRTEYETETEYVETYYLHRKPILRIIYVDGNRAGEESVPSGGEGGNGR